MPLQDYISGYGFDLTLLYLEPKKAMQKYIFDPTNHDYGYTTIGDIMNDTGFNHTNLHSIAESVCQSPVCVFHSNISNCGKCIIYIPDQTICVGTDPKKIKFYSEEEAKTVLFQNTLKVISKVSEITGINDFVDRKQIAELVNTAHSRRWTYAPDW